MHKQSSNIILRYGRRVWQEFSGFSEFFFYYTKKKVTNSSANFEKNKNKLVKFFSMKRGRYNRPFLHLTTMGVIGLGVLVAPFLADTFPIFATKVSALDLTASSSSKQSILVGQDIFQTEVSSKPRDKIITYTVEKGDTISTIAKKFGISEDTIRWENSLDTDDLSIGQDLKILPVSGVAYKVQEGDTVYTIAKKFSTDAQGIVDFPFNDFTNETFGLVTGQMLIVPGGSIQSSGAPEAAPTPQVYVAQGQIPVSPGGWYWPVAGIVTQFASWYHMALDIAGPVGTPVYAAHSGTVSSISIGTWDYGYGTNVWIDDGDGIKTHYAHLACVYVSVGQHVTGGSTAIGCRGNTGRSTGPHTHFEINVNGSLVNPLTYVSQ